MARGGRWRGRGGKVCSLATASVGLTLFLFCVSRGGSVTPSGDMVRHSEHAAVVQALLGDARKTQIGMQEMVVPSVPSQGRVGKKRVLILQTSDDSSIYRQMLDVTAPAHLAYAALHGYGYRRWTGVYKGSEAWLATFNRVYLLQEAYKEGRYDYVMYLDPDAVLVDATLSADVFLDKYGDRMLIFPIGAKADPEIYWDFNIGFGFYNLRHPDFASLYMGRYASEIEALVSQLQQSNVTTQQYDKGLYHGPEDQSTLQAVIKQAPNGSALVHKLPDFNHYVAHTVRSSGLSPSERVEKLREGRLRFLASFEKAASTRSIQLDGPR